LLVSIAALREDKYAKTAEQFGDFELLHIDGSCMYETWSISLRKEHQLHVSIKIMSIFGSKKHEGNVQFRIGVT
jgi:hypothetical protein